MSYNFTSIEKKWQKYWLDNHSFRALDPQDAGDMPKAYVLDMFPYPSGEGLHVGHVIQQTATDILSRYLRMKGVNVLHPMGWDAFGLPAEQHAIKTGEHPAITTKSRAERFRQQIQSLGMSYDWEREINTTDPSYYKWTQWIFLKLFNSYFDPIEKKAKPISQLINALTNENVVVGPDGSIKPNPTQEGLEEIAGEIRVERLWREISPDEQRDIIDGQRLAYMDEAPVNWCPQLGTVLANEEVIDGKSEVGGFPVERRPLRQWMLRITAYCQRLIDDLDALQWPESLKEMQRNWIGRSVGAEVDFAVVPPDENVAKTERASDVDEDYDEDLTITVFTTRPDTLYGATYMVLAPEHPLVDRITPAARRETVEAYRTQVAGKSDRDRIAETKDKTGVALGAFAINPVNDEKIPVFIADYVLMGYGTGAIMAVPAHDQRDFEFAKKFDLPIKRVVMISETDPRELDHALEGEGVAINSPTINGLSTADAKTKIIARLESDGDGFGTIKFKLRDWLFSRQRYWGEPFPILLDAEGEAYAIDESELPLTLPELADFKPTGTPQPPLSKATDWLNVTRDGQSFTRETNVMPQWAGSCWYYLRYLDPKNSTRFVDPEKEKYWMPVDLYVGGVEHAVLHLLYARFWHKVLFDLNFVSTIEPFNRLVNQGTILGEPEFTTVETTPRSVAEDEVQASGSSFVLKSDPSIKVTSERFKMSKSRGNVVNPEDIVRDYGADTFRLYEMYMGPLEAQKPWNTRDIVGMSRFLNGVWRNLIGDEEDTKRVVKIEPIAVPEQLSRQMHRTIKKVGEDIEAMRFNTAIAELIKLNNSITGMEIVPRELAENLVLMLAPFAPHLAEEIWSRLGHTKSLGHRPWPSYLQTSLLETTIELPVQINGKVRDKITVAADADEATVLAAAKNAAKAKVWMDGKSIKKELYVPQKLVNFVVS